MSRIGKAPVPIPDKVSVTLSADTIAVKGPRGQLSMSTNPLVEVGQEDKSIVCKRVDDSKKARSAHGLVRALVANMVHGVSEGFKRSLEINGVGYRAEAKGQGKMTLSLSLGYSHPIEYPLPDGVTAVVEKNIITIEGIDKQVLGAVAADIRGFRPPEPYKGKGIKYADERILRKVGKAAS
jgi:large subunit ribosomal protein L6